MGKLFETTITKKDTCLSYALKRAGIETSVEFAEDLRKEFDFISVNDTKLEVGDIEGDNIISDLTRSTNPYFIPSIRMRYVSLFFSANHQTKCRYPDFVIRKKTSNEN